MYANGDIPHMRNGAVHSTHNSLTYPNSHHGINKPSRKFMMSELEKLNRRDNAHIAVYGKVYDVSSFIKDHPGGTDQIMLGAGRDMSQIFETYHKPSTFKILEKFYVGELISSNRPTFPPRGQFYKTLRERVEVYFRENNLDPKYDPWMFVRYFSLLISAFTLVFILIAAQEYTMLCILLSITWGFISALLAMTFTHDASHFAITHKPWVWKLFGACHDVYQGASMYMWIHQHTLGHHPFTNIDGVDPDIHTHETKPDLRRIKISQGWIPRYIYQHIYVPIIYCFLGLKTRIQDFVLLYNGENSSMKLTTPTWSQLAIFWGGKLFHYNFRFTLLAMYMPFWKMMLFNLLAEFVGSYWLALVFQTSHVISEVEWPQPDENNYVDRDWAELQVRTAQDYATDSWFWSFVTGSLNHQSVHHLFPWIIQSHYIRITPILKQTCKDFNIEYLSVPTFFDALNCHLRHLKILGADQIKEKNA